MWQNFTVTSSLVPVERYFVVISVEDSKLTFAPLICSDFANIHQGARCINMVYICAYADKDYNFQSEKAVM